MLQASSNTMEQTDVSQNRTRAAVQPLLPQKLNKTSEDPHYQIFPYHAIGDGKIHSGYGSLAAWIAGHTQVMIDGYGGVLWKVVKHHLQQCFEQQGVDVHWLDVSDCLRPAADIQTLMEPFLGEPGGVWGKRFSGQLADLFDTQALQALTPHEDYDLTIVYGTGAALAGWQAPIVYFDLPKNEVQYRMRAGSITNLGCEETSAAAEMYKRFYFADWIVLNDHKKQILPRMSVLADAQWTGTVNWMTGESFREGLRWLGTHAFRVRPWFEPGAWGGQWMKEHLEGISPDEVNYAWSFEMIVPENGLVFESDGHLLEFSFDFLMFAGNQAVLGKDAASFGDEFPIRFDFLDTWEGGNLSIQCHPSLAYIKKEFGENITQDETYYILDCKADANVYLGFQENISASEFREVLEDSKQNNRKVEIERYVQSHPAQKHDLFLIPNGTVHSAGANNVVLEISATPYIFTFKMYDWLRKDLNGVPRAINIEHAFNNLRFDRKGSKVRDEFISKPSLIEEGKDWKRIHLPTHREHFYDVHRLEFDSQMACDTNNTCHVLMLVEGEAVRVTTADGSSSLYHFAETFVLPAAAGQYTLTNQGSGRAKVIKAFVKDDFRKF